MFSGLNKSPILLLIVVLAGCPSSMTTNQPPTADAGPDQAVGGGAEVTLDATASSDADGAIDLISWTQIAGPAVELTDPRSANPVFRAPNETATLRFLVEVTDDAGLVGTDSVNIEITFAQNVPPIASAGSGQTVRDGEGVTLDGSGSVDPDGDALSFDWVQVGGVDVNLSDSDTPMPSFVAPSVDGALTFELTVDDGQGNADTDSTVITVNLALELLFVANFSGNSLLRVVDPASKTGNVAPDVRLSGADTLLDGPADLVVTRESWLIVANRNSDALNLYLASAVLSGTIAPSMVVSGAATLLDQPTSMAYDPNADILFVSNTGGSSQVLVFPGPAGTIFSGNLEPVGVISSAALSLPAGIALDTQDRLYVANTGRTNVLVFEDATTLNGAVEPTRTITSSAFEDVIDVFVDGSDRLFVLNSTGTVLSFAGASALTGNETPSTILMVSGAKTLAAIVVDSSDVGYILDSQANAIVSFDSISSRSGLEIPDRAIVGDDTGLETPIGLALVE